MLSSIGPAHLHLLLHDGQVLLDLVHVLDVLVGGGAGRRRLPVGPQPAGRDVGLAAPAAERALVAVQPDVQLQVDVLGEAARALLARERLVARVQPLVRLQVGRGAELAVALAALVRTLTFKFQYFVDCKTLYLG